jgi:O-antigen ligase
VWGTTEYVSLNYFGVNFSYLDIAFVILLTFAWLEYKKNKTVKASLEYSIGKELAVFILYTIFLVFYSLSLGCAVTTAIRFCINIWHYSIYYFIPYIIYDQKRLDILKKIMIAFLMIGYFIYTSQNVLGWQPASVTDMTTSMSHVENVGLFFRTWNPFQQWLVAATCFSIAWIIFVNRSVVSITLFIGLLLFVFLSFARNVYIGLIFALIAFIVQKMIYQRKIKKAFIMLFSIIALLIILFQLFPFVVDRFESGFIDIAEESGSVEHRTNILLVTEFLKQNTLLGAGYNVLDVQTQLESIDDILLATINSGADSHLIMLYYRFGIIGMILFAYISITFVRKNLSRIKIIGINKESIFILCAVTYTIMIWVQAVASSSLLSEPSISINLTIWAISDCIWRMQKSKIAK